MHGCHLLRYAVSNPADSSSPNVHILDIPIVPAPQPPVEAFFHWFPLFHPDPRRCALDTQRIELLSRLEVAYPVVETAKGGTTHRSKIEDLRDAQWLIRCC